MSESASITTLPRVKDTYVACKCGAHALVLDSWTDGDCYLTYWEPSQAESWGRFRWAWECLRGRWKGCHEVILDRSHAETLKDAIESHLLITTNYPEEE